ncbi:MAG: DMT family transporter [Gammaproteobacteria bacterium]|nr:DMT family transporter [Gammaproteobacteria bacterium]
MTWTIPARAVVLALVIHTLWGANPVAVKVGLEVFPPLWSGCLRFVLGSACVIVWARVMGVSLWPPREEWPVHIGLTLIFTTQIAMMNIGFGATTAANSAVLIAANPIFGVFFAHWWVPGDRLTPGRLLGVFIAFAGTALVLVRWTGDATNLDATHFGDWMVLGSACILGMRLALCGRMLRTVNEIRLTLWQMLLSVPLFLVGGLAFETVRLENLGWAPVAGILYQGIVVAGLGFSVQYYLLRRYKPSVMISFNFVAPVAGVLLGMWILGEHLTAGLLGGMALVAVGITLLARK